jgi:hypothetical protein
VFQFQFFSVRPLNLRRTDKVGLSSDPGGKDHGDGSHCI